MFFWSYGIGDFIRYGKASTEFCPDEERYMKVPQWVGRGSVLLVKNCYSCWINPTSTHVLGCLQPAKTNN